MARPAPQKTASRVARPAARYRPGKAPLGADAPLDDSDSEEVDGSHDNQDDHYVGQMGFADLSSGTAALIGASGRKTAGIVINEAGPSSKKLDLRLNPSSGTAVGQDDDSSEYETDTDEQEEPAKPVFRKPGLPHSAPQQSTAADDSSEYETDSDESEDESAPPPMLKPVFVPKRARTTISADTSSQLLASQDDETAAEAEAARRRKEAHDLAAATIQRSLAEKEHASTNTTDVDDTDGRDPTAEFEAWRLRELARLHRDRDALLAKLTEQKEIESFKSLPEAEKERLGRERAAKLQAEKREQRGNPAFLQKYYHKGSFFQDMDILKRDYTEKTSKDVDVSQLPKMMQVRGYGVKGRSRWTHLANEDTSKDLLKVDVKSGGDGRGCFRCGGPHLKKDCPQGARGSNTVEMSGAGEGSRKWGQRVGGEERERQRSRSPERESRKDDHYRIASGSRDRQANDTPRHDHRESSSRRSREDREHTRHSSSHRPSEKQHRLSYDDEHGHRSHRSRHEGDDRRHRSSRHDDESSSSHRHRDERSDRDEQRDHKDRRHHRSTSRDEESDRKRSRVET